MPLEQGQRPRTENSSSGHIDFKNVKTHEVGEGADGSFCAAILGSTMTDI